MVVAQDHRRRVGEDGRFQHLSWMHGCGSQTTNRDDVQPDHVVFGVEQGDDELLPVRLPSGQDEVLDQAMSLLGVADAGLTERDGCVFDQGHSVDGYELAGGLVG